MYKTISIILFIVLAQPAFCQSSKVQWGDEFKFDKKSGDIEVIYADNSGIYIKESHMVLNRLSLVSATRESATLIKCDQNLNKKFTSDFNKELRGKEFERIMFLGDRLYLFATDYVRRDGMLMLYVTEISKSDGKQVGKWKEIAGGEKEERGDELNYQLSYNSDSTKLLLVSTREGKGKNNYEVRQFDAELEPVSKPVTITNEFRLGSFDLEDVVFTSKGTIAIIGVQYDVSGKKPKFKGYSVRLYSAAGKQIKDIKPGSPNQVPRLLKLVQLSQDQLALTAFYSGELGGDIKGVLTARIDAVTGDIAGADSREINGEISSEPDKAENVVDSLEPEPGTNLEISKTMIFRNFVSTPDNGLIVIAEKFNSYSYSRSSSTQAGSMVGYSRSTNFYTAFDCGDIMIFKMGEKGDIKWLKILPKFQHEVIETGSQNTNAYPGGNLTTGVSNYYIARSNRPYYAGFGVYSDNEKITLLVNDYDVNAHITKWGQKPRNVSFLGHTVCFAVNYNINDGSCTRNILFSNRDKGVPVAMPRLGKMLDGDFYMVGKQDRILGKSKVAVARITLSD
jgi:hypothetical protein